MKTKFSLKNLERGQVIPILVIGLLVVIMMAALLIDGGALMANRRTAQAAADAGALAGAQRICEGKDDPVVYAQMFVGNNGAVPLSIDVVGNQVTVVTTVENPSFFARIFRQDTLQATAEAVAGCYYPSITVNPLPIAFYYAGNPINNADCSKEEIHCEELEKLVSWNYDDLIEALTVTSVPDQPLDAIYIVSDKTKVCFADGHGDIICSEAKNQESGGNRTFLDLSPLKTSGSQNLGGIISEGIDQPLVVPIWVNGDPGTVTAAYNSQHYENLPQIPGHEDLDARLVFVPVFTDYCPKTTKWDCAEKDDNFIDDFKNQQKAYHLKGLAPFVVTCITMSDECKVGRCIEPDHPSEKATCPGFRYYDGDTNFKNAIEGYFVTEFPADVIAAGIDGVDAGMYLISLSK